MPTATKLPPRKGLAITERDVERASKGKPLIQIAGRTQLYHGRVYLKPERFKGIRRNSQRVLLKQAESLEEGRRQVALADMLRFSGLPVPKMGIVVIRNPKTKFDEYYIAIEPFLRKGRSIIVPANPEKGNPNPKSLEILRVRKADDRRLIITLARDLARMYNLKMCPKALDFWGLYYGKKGAHGRTLKRIIFDLEEVQDYFHLPDERLLEFSLDSLNKASKFLGEDEFELFERIFRKYLILRN